MHKIILMKHRLFITTLSFLLYTLSTHYTAPATEETLVENNEASTPTGSDEPAMEGNTNISNWRFRRWEYDFVIRYKYQHNLLIYYRYCVPRVFHKAPRFKMHYLRGQGVQWRPWSKENVERWEIDDPWVRCTVRVY